MTHIGFGPRKGTQVLGKCLLAIAMYALLGENTSATPITYDIGTINFPGGHTATGTITTNGTLGLLSLGDFTSWNINVTGPRPFVFSDTSPASPELQIVQVSASPAQLSTTGHIQLGDFDNSEPDCTDCVQAILWEPGTNLRRYYHADEESGDTEPEVTDDLPSFDSPMIIGTVPEPTTSALVLAVTLFFVGRRRGR